MTTYYHLTPSSKVPDILRKGLIPSRGGGLLKRGETPHRGIFLARSQRDALENLDDYRDTATPPLIRKWSLLKIVVPKALPLFEDESELSYTPRRIAPKYITVVREYDLYYRLLKQGVPIHILSEEMNG